MEYREVSLDEADCLYGINNTLVYYRFRGWDTSFYNRLDKICGGPKTPSQFSGVYTTWEVGLPSFHVLAE